MPLMPTGQLTSALTAETSGSMGIIIGAIAGVIIGLALALVFVRRRCHPNDKRHKNITPQAPKGSQAQIETRRGPQIEPDEKGAAASTVTAELDETATPEPKLAVATEVEHFKLGHASEPWSAGSPSKQATVPVVIAEAAADGHAGGPAGHAAGRPAQPAPPEWI
jgi:hypothetical protein